MIAMPADGAAFELMLLAPTIPHAAVGGLDVSGEAWSVHIGEFRIRFRSVTWRLFRRGSSRRLTDQSRTGRDS